MPTANKEIHFRIDDRVRIWQEVEYTQTGLVQRVKNNPVGGVWHVNVLSLAYQRSGNKDESEIGDMTYLGLVCNASNPQKVQVQLRSSLDPNILAWCDYLRTEKRWIAVIPEVKPNNPPWSACTVPIELTPYCFQAVAGPEGREAKALDFIFMASGGRIPESKWRHLMNLFKKKGDRQASQ